MEERYNYVFYAVGPFLHLIYRELERLPNVKMFDIGLPSRNKLLNRIFQLHWSRKMNSKIALPLKSIWFHKMAHIKFPEERPICYIFFGGQYLVTDKRLADYLHKQNPENKVAIHFADLIAKKRFKDFDGLKRMADIVYTYDRGEAEKYGIYFFNKLIYSQLQPVQRKENFTYDLLFVGYAKDRQTELLQLYKYLTEKKVRCCFHIVGTQKEGNEVGEGLFYDDKPMPYEHIIDLVQKSRTILELCQKGAQDGTMRTQEAITYQRKLLSNRESLLSEPYYNAQQMAVLRKPEEIDISFLLSPIPYSRLMQNVDFSPVQEIAFLEQAFVQGNKT